MKIKIIGIMYLISGYLFTLITILMNPINIFIDTSILFGFFLITIGFLIMFLKINKPNKMKISRKVIKCMICYSDELSRVSDIKNSDERFEMLNEFFHKIQNIVYRETKREFLKNWRKFKLPYPYK